MSAQVLDGKSLATETEAELLARVEKLKDKSGGKTPILATILVGEDPASATYVKMKGNACRRVGMESMAVEMPSSTSTEDLLAKITELNENPDVHGILLQHPVPDQIDELGEFLQVLFNDFLERPTAAEIVEDHTLFLLEHVLRNHGAREVHGNDIALIVNQAGAVGIAVVVREPSAG